MAQRADVQYVRFGVDGTAARKAEYETEKRNTAPAYRRKAQKKVIAVDPVALAGILLSAVVLVAMVAGLVKYQNVLQDSRQMSQYVAQLEQENVQLEQTYREGYDLDEIMDIALEAGMVPAENVERVMLSVEEPEEEQSKTGFWSALTTFLTGIFA